MGEDIIMRRRFLCLLLFVSLLLASAVGLGAEAASDEWMAPYSEPISVSIALIDLPTVEYPAGEDVYNNAWTKVFKEKFNVEVVTDWVAPDNDSYAQKLNLAIASGSIPDMFYAPVVQFRNLVAGDLLEPLNDAYETYAYPPMRRMFEEYDPITFETAHENKTLYGIPRMHYGYETLCNYIWIRKNWYEAAGSPPINTLDQFEKLMDTFKETNDSRYALAMDKDLNLFYYFAPSWHAAPKVWVDDGTGGIGYGSVQPEMKDALATFARWYQEGYLHPDFATMNLDMVHTDVLNEEIGLEAFGQWHGWAMAYNEMNRDEQSYLEAYDLPSVDDEPVMQPIQFPNMGYSVVKKGYDNPEILVKLTNYFMYLVDDAGATGDMTMEELAPYISGQIIHMSGPFKMEFPHYDFTKEVLSSIKTGDVKLTTGNAINCYDDAMSFIRDGNMSGIARYLQMGQDQASVVLALRYVDEDLLLFDKMYGPPPQTVLDYGTTLDALLTEGFTRIIMGVDDIDAFDTLVENWKTAGGDEMTAAINAMYGS